MKKIPGTVKKTNAGGLICIDDEGNKSIVTLLKLPDDLSVDDFKVGERVIILKENNITIGVEKDSAMSSTILSDSLKKISLIKMKLFCKPLLNGIMAYWEKVEDAASYTVSLYVNEQIISTRIIERSEMYTSFSGLAAIDGQTKGLFSSLRSTTASPTDDYSGMDYYVEISAENREGMEIAKSGKVLCKVKEL